MFTGFAQSQGQHPLITADSTAQAQWVTGIYDSLTLDEKIGQLFMVDVFSSKGKAHTDQIKKLIREYHLGGVIFSKGGPVMQAQITNEFQEISKVPLLVGMDAEWGLAMRLDSTFAFPYNMTLGAVKDLDLIEQVGKRMGCHAARLGVHISFAPDVDINTNPRNPIIGNRSFGEDRFNVTQKAIALMKGMQSTGVLTCGKHFPGHGDTESDSHHTLPTISFSESRIDSVELYPYKQLINEGLESVMIAHLNVPALETRDEYPSSISKKIVTNLLQEKLAFKGLTFTDALNMKGASNFSSPGDIDLAAFMAGNDILLIPEDVPKAHAKLKEAFEQGIITKERLAHSVKKILMAKYKAGLHTFTPVNTENLVEDLNTIEDSVLFEKVTARSLTTVKNDLDLIPIRNLQIKKIAYVPLGDAPGDVFLRTMQQYARVDKVQGENLPQIMEKLASYNLVVVGLHRSDATPWQRYEFTAKERVWLHEIARKHNVILDLFVKPYALLDVNTISNIETIVVSYQNNQVSQKQSAQLLFGAIPSVGVLPVTIQDTLPVNTSLTTNTLSRLSYGIPESVGLRSEVLKKIDSVMKRAIDSMVVPGAQILVARKGKVVYHKSFGKTDYSAGKTITSDHIYDLASLTKILATLPMVMKLEEEGHLSLYSLLKDFYPPAKGTNKENITLLEMLTHFGRLKPWIPFYLHTLDSVSGKPSPIFYRNRANDLYNTKVVGNLYIRKDYQDTIRNRILETDLLRKREYRYSDLPYYILKEVVEGIYREPLEVLVQEQLYRSLGAYNTTYKPLEKFSRDRIVPSEKDTYFRHQVIHGYVHDMGAAMQGGVGGHAGLFGNANDVAKIMQMYLWDGYYGGKRYFKTRTVDRFNKCYFCKVNNRRGAGFDKPQLEEVGPTCGCVSMKSFGHSGFTGTYTWADPENEIVYVFLSNRTYPTSENKKLIKEGTRTVVQQIIYDAITNQIK